MLAADRGRSHRCVLLSSVVKPLLLLLSLTSGHAMSYLSVPFLALALVASLFVSLQMIISRSLSGFMQGLRGACHSVCVCACAGVVIVM